MPVRESSATHAAVAGCRFCGLPLTSTVVDLGMSPLCESFLRPEQLDGMEPFYPLHVRMCDGCLLVQLPEYVAPADIFTEYAYFSSYSDAFVAHAREYVDSITRDLGLSGSSSVVELASNDGYLLQHFVERGIPVLGIEPARNVAEAAVARGVPTRVAFFGTEFASELVAEGLQADLIIGNNVLSQVPDINDFVAGMKLLLAPEGVITVEFPHLMQLLEDCLFDTIYHEHYSYFSFATASQIFEANGLEVFDVEEVWTHGGSLRLHVGHDEEGRAVIPRVDRFRERELAFGLDTPAPYDAFRANAERAKGDLLAFLIEARRSGKTVVGYGAPGKGNTLLNYCGIRADLLEYTVDRNPYKHGLFLPGTHIPIFPPERIEETKPDSILIMPWNLKDEIVEQLSDAREWGAEFVVAVPALEVLT